MRILVTGGAGFIGSHVAEAYVSGGHRVWIVDDLSTGKKENVPTGAELCAWDIGDARMGDLLRREKIEFINHPAAHMDIRESAAAPVFDARVNVLGLLSLLEAARRAGTRRVLFSSTGGAIYGDQEEFPAKETHPTQPDSPYGIAKLAGEKYLGYYQKVHGLIPVVLRYANVYGPRQNPFGEAGVVAIFTAKMLRGESPLLHGSGKQTRDFIYIDDVVAANVLALGHAGKRPCLFNVGTGKETDIRTVFHQIKTLTGFSGRPIHDAAKEGEQFRSSIDSSRIAKSWKWKNKVPLSEGLARTVEWFREKT